MSESKSIVINGDLGSGKTTVAGELAARIGLRRVSLGTFYRKLAASRGMTTLELNAHSHSDESIDEYIDAMQRDLAESGEPLVVDSRLGWHFFTDSFKVTLIADPEVAARRAWSRLSETESYSSFDETRLRLQERSESERARFLARYGVDKSRLRNYDLVLDTTRLSPGQVVDRIIASLATSQEGRCAVYPGPSLMIDPTSIHPKRPFRDLLHSQERGLDLKRQQAGALDLEPLLVGYSQARFFIVAGHSRLNAALKAGLPVIPAALAAEGGELLADGFTADEYFESRPTGERSALR